LSEDIQLARQVRAALVVLLAFFVMMLSAACSNAPATPSPAALSQAFVPTPSPGNGVVVGQLQSNSPGSWTGLTIFLGDLVLVGEQRGGFLNREKAPIGRIDEATGKFVFVDVPPGQYSLILSEPEVGSRAYLVPSGEVKVVEVSPGKIIDVGDIPIDQ
jgi:hypothetical protein